MLIADFIQENPNIVVVDKFDSLRNEIKALFDNEILHRLGDQIKNANINEENIQKIKELLYEKMNIDANIHFYEDLLLKNRAIGKNTIFTEGMLQKLRHQKIYLENTIKNIQEQEVENENKFQNNINSIKPCEDKEIEENKISPMFNFNDEQKCKSPKSNLQSMIYLIFMNI